MRRFYFWNVETRGDLSAFQACLARQRQHSMETSQRSSLDWRVRCALAESDDQRGVYMRSRMLPSPNAWNRHQLHDDYLLAFILKNVPFFQRNFSIREAHL